MKVLVVHNHYRSTAPSGEDTVVQNEIALLRAGGVEVVTYERHNDEIADGVRGLLQAAGSTVWSRRAYRELRAVLIRERPDVAHFHNLWYLISPSAYEACRDLGVPVVQTLHNYRMFCANGLLMREGRVCEDCVGGMPWRGAFRGCFRSPLHSLPIVASELLHRLRETWTSRVDAFIALGEFARAVFVRCGLPAERIHVKPNFFDGEVPAERQDGGYALFLGRLSVEKGPDLLLEAASRVAVPVKIVGDGPLRAGLEAALQARGLRNVELLGRKSHAECLELLARSAFLVVPSRCYENFPMAVVEAFACGKPVVAARLGALAELVGEETGLLFDPGSAVDLARAMRVMAADPQLRATKGERARARSASRFAPASNREALLRVYEAAIGSAHGRRYEAGVSSASP